MSLFTEVVSFAVRLTLNLTLLGLPIVAGVALALRLCRAVPPRTRYITVLIALLAAIIIPVAVTFRSPDGKGGSQVTSLSTTHSTPNDVATSRQGDVASVRTLIPHFQFSRLGASLSGQLGTLTLFVAESPLGPLLLASWLTIAALLVGREIKGHLFWGKARGAWQPADEALRIRLRWPDSVPLYLHNYEGPNTTGVFKPAVVLPTRLFATLSPEAVQRVARHELSHVLWRDPLVNAVIRLLRAAFWPSVPLWLLERMARFERESSADSAAVGALGATDVARQEAADYASTLIAIADWPRQGQTRRHTSAATPYGGVADLEGRIRRLLITAERHTKTRAVLACAALLSGLCVGGYMPAASRTSEARSRVGRSGLSSRQVTSAEPQGQDAIRSDRQDSREQTEASEALDALLDALQGKDWQVRGEVFTSLQRIKASGTVEPLLLGLQTGDDGERERIAWALGQLKDARAVEALIVLLNDESPRVRHTGAWALGMIGDRRAVAPLIRNLTDESSDVRHASAWALGKIGGDAEAVEPLILLLQDDSSDVRHGAAWALGEIGDQRAVEPLKSISMDGDPDVRSAAAQSLSKLANH